MKHFLKNLRCEEAEIAQIISESKQNHTYLKAPNGQPTNLCPKDWVLVRSQAFKAHFDDWEKAFQKDFLLHHAPVKILSGKEFPPQDGKTLTEQVADYLLSIGGKAISPLFGEVILDRKGADDSFRHGIGRRKAIAYAAVKEVIEGGILIDYHQNHKDRNYDTAVIVAPIHIAQERFVCYTIIHVKRYQKRFYLDEVWTEISLTNVRSNAAHPQPSHLQGTAKILQEILHASTLPKIFFDENGEPKLD